MPLIYGGQEADYNHRLLFFEKDPIQWGDYPLKDFYRSVLTLKHNNPALGNGVWGGTYTRLTTANDNNVLAFMRENDTNRVVVVANLSAQPVTTTLSEDAAEGSYLDYLSSQAVELKAGTQLEMGAWEYHIYVKK